MNSVNITRLFIISFILVSLYFLIYGIGKPSSNVITSVESEQTNFTIKNKQHDVTLSNINVLSWDPRILLIHNFISDEECDHLIELGRNKVKRSKVVGEDGKGKVDNARTSSGVFFTKEQNDVVVRAVANRIAKVTLYPEENGEHFYLLRYNKGEEYMPHTDWFDRIPSNNKILKRGQRVVTVVSYLSDVEEGGETVFPELDISVKPTKGSAIVFWNIDTEGREDPRVLHGSNPVIKGTKWAMTKWVRSISQD